MIRPLPIVFLMCTLVSLPVPRTQASEPFLLLQGGKYIMGSPASEISRELDEKQRQITIPAFYMGTREVSQREYRELMGENPSQFKGDELPVENISWFEAVAYCNARSLHEGLEPAYTFTGTDDAPAVVWNLDANGYRLPTEAEWEYACRAGTTSPFSTGGNVTTAQANYYGTYPYNDNPTGQYRNTTTPTGSFPPNPWGLYDMHGNVWEWCWDWYGAYDDTALTQPLGPTSGTYRVNRGGGWNDFGRHLRSSYRAACPPDAKTFNLGFRLARNAS